MAGPRPLSDPRPVVYLGAPASFALGFVTVAAVLAAGFTLVRRWWP